MYDVCVVGFGALGTLYAYAIERSGQARITAVCRSNVQVMNDYGVKIESEKFGNHPAWKPYRAVASCAEAADRQYRFVVCGFKALPDVITTPDLLGPLLEKADAFVLIQNGVGIQSDLQNRLPNIPIISGCAWIDATLVDGGRRLTQNGLEALPLGFHRPPPELTSSFPENAAQESLQLICDLLTSGGGTSDPQEDIETQRWTKLLSNAAWSPMCTFAGSSMGEALDPSHAELLIPHARSVMEEVVSVAAKLGTVDVNYLNEQKDKVIEQTMLRVDGGNNRFKPSMLVDVEAGRPIEVEVIIGYVVRKAAEHGVSVPRLDVIYAHLKIIQYRLRK